MSESSKSSDESAVPDIKSSQLKTDEKNDSKKIVRRPLTEPSGRAVPEIAAFRMDPIQIMTKDEYLQELKFKSPVSFTSSKSPSAAEAMRLNSELLNAIELHEYEKLKSLLQDGASPDATCRYCDMSACHVAVTQYYFSGFQLLLEYNADKNKRDKLGRTPLHLATWVGHDYHIGMLLDFPADISCIDLANLKPEVEENIRQLRSQISNIIDDPCEPSTLPNMPITWTDNNEHDCERLNALVPEFPSGWTPLHIASYAAHQSTTRLLLAAGANPNSKDDAGQTPLDVAGAACFLENSDINIDNFVATITALIEYGGELNPEETPPGSYSALHTAVELRSAEAVRCLLAAGAPVTHNTLRAAIDLAASKENIEILNEILSVRFVPDTINLDGSALSSVLYAIRSGDLNCVQKVVNAGASLSISGYEEPIDGDIKEFMKHCGLCSTDTLIDDQRNSSLHKMIVHATVAEGTLEILKYLLDHDKNLVELLDQKSTNVHLTPVELAALYKKNDIFKFLFELNTTESKSKGLLYDYSMLLKIIVYLKQEDMLNEVLKTYPNICMTNKRERCPLIHNAIKHANEEMLMQLITHGADLALRDEDGRTAISLLMEHYPKPMDFIAKLFDQQLDCVSDFLNPTITVDYSVLAPQHMELVTDEEGDDSLKTLITVDNNARVPQHNNTTSTTTTLLKDEEDMSVLTAILQTGDDKGQRNILTHPLVESFLFLIWKTHIPLFCIIFFLYSLFVVSLSVNIVSVFYHKDKNMNVPEHIIWHPVIWQCIMLLTLCFMVTQEFLCTSLTIQSFIAKDFWVNLKTKSWISQVLTIELCVKLGSYFFALTTPFIVTIESPDTEWRRILATLTLLLAWMNMILLLSKIPISGSYVQMFWMVSTKIIEILLTFLFLIIMFSFCFMIQTHNQGSFDGPIAALVKTVVMLTSELDYENAIRKDEDNNISISLMLHDIFVIFLILASIVMMNLLTSVAVNDVQELILAGNLRKLETQVEFLISLKILKKRSGLNRLIDLKKLPRIVKIKQLGENKYYYNEYIRKAILIKLQEKKNEEKVNKNQSKLDKIIQAVVKNEENISTIESKLDKIIQSFAKQYTSSSSSSSSLYQPSSEENTTGCGENTTVDRSQQ